MISTTFFIIFIPILAILLLAINQLLAAHNPYQEKDSVFECSFHTFLGQNRTQFSVSFFIFGLLFLLFDLEILLVYPYSVSSYTNDIYGIVIMMVFFVLLTLGFILELGKNALTIDSRQTHTNTYSNEDTNISASLLGKQLVSSYLSFNSMYSYVVTRLVYNIWGYLILMFITCSGIYVKWDFIWDLYYILPSVHIMLQVLTLIIISSIFLGAILESQRVYQVRFYIWEWTGLFIAYFDNTLENLVLSSVLPDYYSGFLCILGISMVLLNIINRDSTSLRDKFILLKEHKFSELLGKFMLIVVVLVSIRSLLWLTGFSLVVSKVSYLLYIYYLFCNMVLVKIVLISIRIATGKEINLKYLTINLSTIIIFFFAATLGFHYIIPSINRVLATELTDGGLRNLTLEIWDILDTQNLRDKVHNILTSIFCFEVIHCSGPSKATDMFGGLPVTVTPRGGNLTDISNTSAPTPLFDFSGIDSMLNLLKENISTFSDERIKEMDKEIKDNMQELSNFGTKTHKSYIVQLLSLIAEFRGLEVKQEFSDLRPVMKEWENMVKNSDNKKPDVELLESNPIEYWNKQITYANKVQTNSNQQYNLFKKYVKDNNLLSTQDKTLLFTKINELKKSSTIIADTDKALFKQCKAKSVILAELKANKGK